MMRISVVAVGRAREPAIRALWLDYAERCNRPLDLREVEDKKRGPGTKDREGKLLREAIPAGAFIVALDPKGRMLESPAFAAHLAKWVETGAPEIAFVIGGADGLSTTILEAASFTLSLGALTLPHMLARIVIAEQIYRAQTILDGHPYHRE